MNTIFVTLLLLALLIILLYIYFTWNFNYWEKLGVKGPKPKLFLGTQHSAITHNRNIIYDYLEHYNEFKGTEKFIGLYTTRAPELMILDPDTVKEIYITKFRSFADNYFSLLFDVKKEPLFGLNPFFLNRQEWKEKRAEMIVALTPGRIKASYPVMMKVCSKMVDFIKKKIEAEGKDHVFNCRELTQRFTIQNIADVVYGLEAGAFEIDSKSEILRQAADFMQSLFSNFNYLFVLGSIPLLGKIWQKRLSEKEGEKFFTTLMEQAIKLRKESNQTDRVDFLNYLIQLQEKKGLTNLELQANAITFFLDGYETSSLVLSHFLLCMGRNKEAQSKLRHEIEINSLEDGTITYEKLVELPYLDQCVNETLRLFPPGSFIQKVCIEDTDLINADGTVCNIKKDTPVTVPIYCIQTDERFYSNATEFIPERFNSENGGEKKLREMGRFIPFGIGPRACLGQRFAFLQIKTCVYELVKNFEITVSSKTRSDDLLDPKNMQLFLEGGIWCTFKELKN